MSKIKKTLGCVGTAVAVLGIGIGVRIIGFAIEAGESKLYDATIGRLLNQPEWKRHLEARSYQMGVLILSNITPVEADVRTLKLETLRSECMDFSKTIPEKQRSILRSQLINFANSALEKSYGDIKLLIDPGSPIIDIPLTGFKANKGLVRAWEQLESDLSKSKSAYSEFIQTLSDNDKAKTLLTLETHKKLGKERINEMIESLTSAPQTK